MKDSSVPGDERRPQSGDPVTVQEVGWPWTAKELLPYDQGGMFGVVTLTAFTVAQVRQFLFPEVEEYWDLDPSGSPHPDTGLLGHPRREHRRHRAVKADVKGRLATKWAELLATGRTDLNRGQARNMLRRKSDDTQVL